MMIEAGNDNDEERSISRQASAWFVMLEEAPDDTASRTAFEAWLCNDPRHAAAWQETIVVTAAIDRAYPSKCDVPAIDRRGGRDRRGSRWHMWAGSAVAATMAWLAMPSIVTTLRADQSTGTAEIRTITLADGSRIVLAPGSALAVSMERDRRNVRLLSGEAWFDVVHDPHRPFLVTAGESRVRVLGTAFDVHLTEGRTGVAVERGAVAASIPGRADFPDRIVRIGQTLDLYWRGGIALGKIQPRHVAAWRNGRAVFVDRPLGEVIDALKPWYRGYLLGRGAGLESERVTGVYDLRDPDAALDALAKAHRIEVRQITPWARLVSVP